MTFHCRICGEPLTLEVADLGASPLSNAFLAPDDLDKMEPHYPLHAQVCTSCWLVQIPAVARPDTIFSDYLYFSSYSDSWLRHCAALAVEARSRFGLGPDSLVIEAASNDGYLLQFFKESGIPVLGIEPAANVARHAEAKGIRTIPQFLGAEMAGALAAQGFQADLLLGLNVLAHVPDLHDFVAGLALLLKPRGTLVLEFPHLLELLRGLQFDTIYHEHFSYLAMAPLDLLFPRHGLAAFDVERQPTHGGSLRLFICKADDPRADCPSPSLEELRSEEKAGGLCTPEPYRAFSGAVAAVKNGLLQFLLEKKAEGARVAGYGAPAKGNTLLNYAGVRPDLLPFTVDRSPHKQGQFLPGSRIPILAPEAVLEHRPDYLLVLPWNLLDEITVQMEAIRSWGGRFAVAVPRMRVLP